MPIAADIYYQLHEGAAEGEKPNVVLIHGAGGNYLYWPPEVRRLLGYRVYALDLPGHGKSEGRGHQSISMYAESVLHWMEELELFAAVFVGHSMGSGVVISLALDHPLHVAGLGLIGAGARLRVNPDLLESSASPTTFYNAVETVVSWSFCEKSPPRMLELAAQRMEETRPSVLHGDFLACDDFDASERIAEIRKPALVLCGAEDKMTPQRSAQFLASSMPNAQLEIIPDAGHMVMLEQPQAVASALERFLAGIHV
jgi:pimeloyl-ACP methyl ester carboxylesterase